MAQEDKELLLKDLCARLPYGIKVKFAFNKDIEKTNNFIYVSDNGPSYIHNSCMVLTEDNIKYVFNDWLDECKPYLRSKTKMTKEEKETYHKLCHCVSECIPDIEEIWHYDYYDTVQSISFLQEIHIDIWNLIPKGLAFEAPEGMYNI